MKADIHPDYRFVVFQDVTNNYTLLTRSCVKTKDTITLDGVEYPLVRMDISSESHPFYTGTQKILDSAGRVEKYYQKYGLARPESAEA
jgi:large subunit ribosomal protein L31